MKERELTEIRDWDELFQEFQRRAMYADGYCIILSTKINQTLKHLIYRKRFDGQDVIDSLPEWDAIAKKDIKKHNITILENKPKENDDAI